MSPQREPARALIPLVCATCGGDLLADPGDRVAVCPPCRTAYFPAEGMAAYPLRFIRPALRGTEPVRYLPFWKLEAEWVIRADAGRSRQYLRIPSEGPLYFPAFWHPRFGYSGDITWAYLTFPGVPDFEGEGDSLRGGVRSPQILPDMGRLFILSCMDRIADISGVEVDLRPRSLEYVGVPFIRNGDGWIDGLCGLRFPPTLMGADGALAPCGDYPGAGFMVPSIPPR